MQCPLCKVEMAIQKSRNRLIEENLFIEHELTCRNNKCTNYQKVVEVIRNPLQLSKD